MKSGTSFVNGLRLSQAFYEEVVWPLLSTEGFSKLQHSAGLLDPGSEVFGFDDQRSADHHWGPRVLIFLGQADYDSLARELVELLRKKLPVEFMGYSTNFGEPDDIGVQLLQPVKEGPVNHRVEFVTRTSFFRKWLANWDPMHEELTLAHWRKFPRQSLFAIRNGKLFRDDLDVARICNQVCFHPKTIWLEELIREWSKVEEEEAFVGRTGEVGDEIGSRLISGRILTSLMTITFLLNKEYYPYSKWFGTAFTKLDTGKELEPYIHRALNATNWHDREAHICHCYTIVMRLHNSVAELPVIETEVSNFGGRPFKVPHAGRIVQALKDDLKHNI